MIVSILPRKSFVVLYDIQGGFAGGLRLANRSSYYMIYKGASPAAWKAAGRRLAYEENVSDGVVMDGGKT